MSDHVRIERTGEVLAITLARPERRNAITVAMYAALAEALESARDDAGIRVITIQGQGQDFAAGNDLEDFLKARPQSSDDLPVMRMLRALATSRTPIVAAVQGNCVGIGTTMLLHCDLVIAEPNARFLMPFVDLGLVPEAASTLLLPALAGRRRTARYLLLGEPIDANEALAIGLISHLAPEGGAPQLLQQLVSALLAKPAEALRLTQRLLREGSDAAILERMELEGSHFGERLKSDEVREAITAFFAARAKA